MYNFFCYHNFQRNSVKHWTFVDGNLTRIWAMVSVLRRTIVRADLRESAGTRHNATETAWEIIFVMENRSCSHWRTIWCNLWSRCDRTGRSLNVYRRPFSIKSKAFWWKVASDIHSKREQSDRYANVSSICRKGTYKSPIWSHYINWLSFYQFFLHYINLLFLLPISLIFLALAH